MTRPRKSLISLVDTPYYHIGSRCVRRSFLCGQDKISGSCYEHRRQWIVDRVRLLSSVFAIDIGSYAIMSNHYHLVVKLDPDQLTTLSNDDIINRWLCLFKGPILVQRYRAGEALSIAERDTVSSIVDVWRERLANISWFMKCLNQTIARQANLEDNCTGHFWESRFKSQALTSEEALLSCMAYVDLNPIRAAMAITPEQSDYTSIQERIKPKFSLQNAIASQTDIHDFELALKPLLHFDDVINDQNQNGIPFSFTDYLQLVDWTGRAIVDNKRGSIPDDLPPILQRLNLDTKRWLSNATQFEALHYQRFGKRRAHLANTA